MILIPDDATEQELLDIRDEQRQINERPAKLPTTPGYIRRAARWRAFGQH